MPLRKTGCLALLPGLRPGPLLFLASTTAPFESKSFAAFLQPFFAARWSGVSPQALSRGRRLLWLPALRTRRGRGAAELYTRSTVQPTNEQCMIWIRHLQTVQSKITPRTRPPHIQNNLPSMLCTMFESGPSDNLCFHPESNGKNIRSAE